MQESGKTWDELKDMAIQLEEDCDEYRYVQKKVGEEEIKARKKFLGIS